MSDVVEMLRHDVGEGDKSGMDCPLLIFRLNHNRMKKIYLIMASRNTGTITIGDMFSKLIDEEYERAL